MQRVLANTRRSKR